MLFRKSIINVWVCVSLIHSRPSTTSVNRSGSASRSGRCGFTVSGVALRRRDRTGERAAALGYEVERILGLGVTDFAGGVIRLAVIFPPSKATGICFQPVAPY